MQPAPLDETHGFARFVRNNRRAALPRYYFLAVQQQLDFPSALDRKSTRLNSSHLGISYAVFCLKKKTKTISACLICPCLRRISTTRARLLSLSQARVPPPVLEVAMHST